MGADDRMLDRLARLREAANASAEARAVAEIVGGELRELGAEVSGDAVAGPDGSGAGSLVARVAGRGERSVMLCARRLVPVAALLELLARATLRPPEVGIELALPLVGQGGQGGPLGAGEIDVDLLQAPFGFVLDHASPIGELVTAWPTLNRVVAHFEGVEADAGSGPEEGRSAIAAACVAVASMRLGRLDAETSANVGAIAGGSAVDVVPARCRVDAEARSLDGERASAATQEIVDACTWAASEHGCDVDVEVAEALRGYRVPPGSAPARIAAEALRRCGHEPREVASGRGSDAGALIAHGYDCVLLASGLDADRPAEGPAAAGRIEELVLLCEAIVAVAGEEAEPAC